MKKTTIARIFGAVFLLVLLTVMSYAKVTGIPLLAIIFGTAYLFEKFVVSNMKNDDKP